MYVVLLTAVLQSQTTIKILIGHDQKKFSAMQEMK